MEAQYAVLHDVILACLNPDLAEVGIAGQGVEAFRHELVPGGAECVHDGVVSGQQPVAEVSFAQVGQPVQIVALHQFAQSVIATIEACVLAIRYQRHSPSKRLPAVRV
jgi:hypothetical protein